MIELTQEQWQALAQQGESPPRALNPKTHTTYVLIPEAAYDKIKALLIAEEDDQALKDLFPHVMQVFGEAGWDDPAMDIYNELDPRRQS